MYSATGTINVSAESPSNNVSGSPPPVIPFLPQMILQREDVINQPQSAPVSPLSSLSSPISQLSLPTLEDCTQDPNWQATKSTVRERNAAMFNNHLMADIQFIVGSPGKDFNVFTTIFHCPQLRWTKKWKGSRLVRRLFLTATDFYFISIILSSSSIFWRISFMLGIYHLSMNQNQLIPEKIVKFQGLN